MVGQATPAGSQPPLCMSSSPALLQEADKKAKEKAKKERAAAKKEKVALVFTVVPSAATRNDAGTAAGRSLLPPHGCFLLLPPLPLHRCRCIGAAAAAAAAAAALQPHRTCLPFHSSQCVRHILPQPSPMRPLLAPRGL